MITIAIINCLFLLLFLEDLLLIKAAAAPMLARKHSEPFAFEKGGTPGCISLL